VRRPARKLAETRIKAQAAVIRVTVRRADERDFRFAPAGLFQEIIDEQQVVEFGR
jgi:hypothetical protein